MPIDLQKSAQVARVTLYKKKIVNIQAQIILAVDNSLSMDSLYSDGTVQDIVDRLLAVGMNMDADKSIEVYTFDNSFRHIGPATEENHEDFVTKHGMRANGGTNYAPIMKQIINDSTPRKGFFSKKTIAEYPTFVFFLTDGDNWDKTEAESIIKAAATEPIFWQFVGIGKSKFTFLEKLDDLAGRYVDNADFFTIDDISKMSDEELYDKLLNEFPAWLSEVKTKGMIR